MSSIFLYYDHMHHTWIFNEHLDLAHPQPMAFLAHGAILPIRKTNDHTFRKYGAPKSVHWIVRDAASGGSRPDGTIKVEGENGPFLLNSLMKNVCEYSMGYRN